MKYSTIEDVIKDVIANEGVLTVTQGDLTRASGAMRSTSLVRDGIKRKLEQHSVRHIPIELPNREFELVRLYHVPTAVGEIITAVLIPGENKDELLRNKAATSAEEVLRKVRELVCSREF